MPTIESLISVSQVARLTSLSERTIWRMIGEGRTPETVRVGRAVRFRASEVDIWIKSGCPDRQTFEAAGVMSQRVEQHDHRPGTSRT